MAAIISENEDTETNKTKVSDSGYSNSCSNSQSQRSNSSKSRRSASSGSSGYCGHPSCTISRNGDDDHKKKKSKINTTTENNENVSTIDTSFIPPHPAHKAVVKKTAPAYVDPVVLDSMSSPTIESEALQVAVLAQTLFCIKTKTSEQILDDHEQETSLQSPENKEPQTTEMIISAIKDEVKHEKEFCIVVSLADGTVVYTTSSLTNILGFPKDMWIGRSLINFLHPKDRIAFANHITSAMACSHFKQKDTVNPSDKGEDSGYFYCWIRLYNGLKTSGFNIAEKKATYLTCQLSMNFKEVPDQGVFLVANAHPVKSAYKVPGENRCNPPTFTTRHTADTLISHVDNDVVSHFGYLPHDMIGRSIFDFYYSEDLPYLKDVYTNVVMEEGLLFLSRPYKFRCQNGDSVMLETEWSSFINPWGKKLEFIIGRHRVLTGPHNPDVISPVLEPNVPLSNEEDHNQNTVFQEEIKVLLTEPVVRCYEPSKQQLAQLVDSLEKITSSQLRDQSTVAPVPSAASEMLGEISPHHVYSDSKSSSETPPSYNQLTYNENIQRFFASEPKTAGSDESPDAKNEQNQSSYSGGEESKLLPNNSSFNSNSDSCLNGSGNGSGNSSGLSSNSTRLDRSKPDSSTIPKEQGVAPSNSNNHCEYNTRPLTEEMLYQHNENMNKQMVQKHKKEKNKYQCNRKHKNFQHKTLEGNEQEDQGGHGMKRSGSHSWEGEPMKAFKGTHRDHSAIPSQSTRMHIQATSPITPAVWSGPTFPVTVTMPAPVQPLSGHMNYSSSLVNSIMQLPCVYMNPLPPAPPVVCPYQERGQTPRANEQPVPPLGLHRPSTQLPAPLPYLAHQAQYMPSLMYQLPLVPMVYTQSHIVQPTVKPRMVYTPNVTNMTSLSQQLQQPSSRATSVKGEPGSALCSFASASLKQALSDSSKKGNKSHSSSPIYSPGGSTSVTGKTKTGTFDNDLTHDDTSYCSYSSLFPKTEKSDDSMKDSQDKENFGQYKMWRKPGVSKINTVLRTVRKEPSWMENVEVTPDLTLRYQMNSCVLSQVLQSDFEALLKLHQSDMVNEQLDQLYVDLEGVSKQLTLEESFPSSCSSSDEKHLAAFAVPSTSTTCIKAKKKRKFMCHDKCAMIFEEDAPMPPSSSELLVTAQSS